MKPKYNQFFVSEEDLTFSTSRAHFLLQVKAKENANAFVIGFMPHVAKEDYWLWHQFSVENQDWIAEANAAHGVDDPRFHDNTTLFYPYLHDYAFFDSKGQEVELSYELATCSSTKKAGVFLDSHPEEEALTLADISNSIAETRHVPVEPQDYDLDYYVPVWQLTPPPHPDGGLGLGNFNLRFDPLFEQNFRVLEQTRKTTFYDICDGSKWYRKIETSLVRAAQGRETTLES